MKELTLERAWTLCLRMWAWIIKQLDAGSSLGIGALKAEWTRKNKYRGVENGCFFCQYNKEHGGNSALAICKDCPGQLISARFDCEKRSSYPWNIKPRKFYAKLLELNKKRKKGK